MITNFLSLAVPLSAASAQRRAAGRPTRNVDALMARLDLSPIMFKLSMKDDGPGWPKEKTLRVEGDYRKFLILCAEMRGEPIVPSKEVDEMWHTHILDTEKYAQDCQSVFGYFLHHFPYLGLRGDDDAIALAAASNRTKALYRERFGVQPSGTADCMTGCGSVACSPSSCTNNAGDTIATDARSTLQSGSVNAAPADCMTGCGSVVCSVSSCVNNSDATIAVRPRFEHAFAA